MSDDVRDVKQRLKEKLDRPLFTNDYTAALWEDIRIEKNEHKRRWRILMWRIETFFDVEVEDGDGQPYDAALASIRELCRIAGHRHGVSVLDIIEEVHYLERREG